MERNLTVKKAIALVLAASLLCAVLSGCTKFPRLEQSSDSGTTAPTQTETDTDTQATGGAETDKNGFPNQPEDGYTKRY